MAPAAPSPSAVSLRDAVALSGRFPLLAGVDLEVAVGEAVLVDGPNGAGKTSLLRVCAGLVPLTSGRLTVLGLDPARHRVAVRRRVGLLSHASHLYDDLTVHENVRFAVRAAGGEVARIAPACDRWGLSGRLARTPAAKLSAGQRRRVALAVLTARWPELWLLDEPHAGLDAAARALLDEAVVEASAAGVTILIASHESGTVEGMAHRAVTVTGGRVTAGRTLAGPPMRPAAVEGAAVGVGDGVGDGADGVGDGVDGAVDGTLGVTGSSGTSDTSDTRETGDTTGAAGTGDTGDTTGAAGTSDTSDTTGAGGTTGTGGTRDVGDIPVSGGVAHVA